MKFRALSRLARKPARRPSRKRTVQSKNQRASHQVEEYDSSEKGGGLFAATQRFTEKIAKNATKMALLGAGLSLAVGASSVMVGGAVCLGSFLVARFAKPQSKAARIGMGTWLLSFPAMSAMGPLGVATVGAVLGTVDAVGRSIVSMAEPKF